MTEREKETPDEEIVDSPTPWVASHIRTYLKTGGAKGHLYHGNPTLLLTTRGRRSGRLRRTALIYGEDEGRYLVVASNGGADAHPAWYLNLTADPDVRVQLAADVFPARAHTASPEEKPPLWDRMTSIFPLYAKYQSAADRDIPLVILTPTTP